MKVVVGADTSQFDRGMRAAKSELRDFGKVSDGILGKLGEAVGIDTQQVERMSSAIRGMGRQMQESGSEGTAAFGKLLSSVSSLGAGIAALGIAGVVAGFKALNAEAENFKNTVAGANIELQTQAYISTFKQAMHDMNSEVGESVAEAQADWQKGWATFGPRLAATLAAAPGGTATGFGMAAVGQPQLQLQKQINDEIQSAVDKAERASEIAGELYSISRQQSDNTREIARLSADIAEQQLISRDNSYSIAERSAAISKAEELIRQKYALQLPLEQQKAALMDEQVNLTSSTVAEADAANQQAVRAISLEKQQAEELRSLTRTRNTLLNQQNKMNAGLQKELELQKQIAQSRADLAALDLRLPGIAGPGAFSSAGSTIGQTIDTTAFQGEITRALGSNAVIQLGVEIDKGSLIDLTRQVESIVSGLAVSLGAAIGGLVGDLMTGGDAWGNFASAAMSAFGDMATSVGKIAIECGVAALGIKAALETLGPGGAIAAIVAGTALVALGAAVKAGLSNVASGNYSATANVASGGYSSAGNNYETREVSVQVTGTLEADGDKLVAVISGANNKKGYTT